MLQLNYRDTKPIYEQIRDEIKKLLVTQAIKENEKLPSVREMASGLAINPNTIQRAYHELEKQGYVYSVPGKGTFASNVALEKRQSEMFQLFDEAVEELLSLSVHPSKLRERIDSISEEEREE